MKKSNRTLVNKRNMWSMKKKKIMKLKLVERKKVYDQSKLLNFQYLKNLLRNLKKSLESEECKGNKYQLIQYFKFKKINILVLVN